MRIKLIIFFFFASYFVNINSITLTESIDMAIANNHELNMAKEDVIIAEKNYNEVRGQLFPQLNLNATYNLTKNHLPRSVVPQPFSLHDSLEDPITRNEEIIAGTFDTLMGRMVPSSRNREEANLATQISLTQPIFLGGQLINGIRVLDRVKTLQERKFELELQSLVITVINAYYDLFLVQEGLAIQRQALINAELHFERVANLYSQGLVSEYDKLRAELEVSRLQPEVLTYENLENLAEENFNRIIGHSGDVVLSPFLDDITQTALQFDISLEDSLQLGSENRIELYLSKLMADIYQVQLDAEKMNFAPNLLLQADITRYASNSSSYSIHGDDFGTMGSVGLVFTMPLFTGLSNTSRALRAKHELRKADYDVLNTTDLINLEIRQTWQSFSTSKKFLDVQELNMSLAERALTIAEARFQNQAGIQLEVFDAQIQYNAAQISLAEAKIRIIKDFYALNKALGIKLNNLIGEI